MPRLDWLRMIVRKGRHGSRGIDHHIPLAEECAPLLLKLQPRRIGREPVAVARDCATRPLGMQTVIIGAQPCAHALRPQDWATLDYCTRLWRQAWTAAPPVFRSRSDSVAGWHKAMGVDNGNPEVLKII